MKTTPLVSIYITNHNYGRFIKEAIESILNQTLKDFELIIIDDGSTDNSRVIIEEYDNLEYVKIIFQKNKGLNISNNIAMRAASGKYIMRLDADDYLDQNALLVLTSSLEENKNLGLVFPDYYIIDQNSNIIGIEKRHEFGKDVSLFDQPAHGACTMIRREFLMQLNGYDENYDCQDGYELWIRFINHFEVNNIPTPLFYYRQHGNNLTSNEIKILETRSKIKAKHVKSHDQLLNILAVIPIRDNPESYSLAFEKLNHKYVIDWKIEEVLKANQINHVVVSSSNQKIGDHINNNYISKEISFLERDHQQSRLNIDLSQTIDEILSNNLIADENFDAVMILGIEFPFIKASIIDDAVNTMKIFGADSLISVRPETNLYFQHRGKGMEPILNQNKFTKLEREALYRYTGGISLSKVGFFRSNRKFIGGKVGHIIIDQTAAHGIFTNYDLNIARFLSKNQSQ